MSSTILFFGKAGDFYCERAVDFINQHFSDVIIVLGKRGDPLPEKVKDWQGDYLVSYLSPWIIPNWLLEKTKKANINFHPGPPEYPGIGCTNFAIYYEEMVFGITCHHMNAKVDTGDIIAVRRFPLLQTDSVYSLTQRCYASILELFYEIMALILQDLPLPVSKETWQRKPFRRKELNALCALSLDMSEEEIAKRVRALTFPNAPGAYIKIGNMKFDFTTFVKEK